MEYVTPRVVDKVLAIGVSDAKVGDEKVLAVGVRDARVEGVVLGVGDTKVEDGEVLGSGMMSECSCVHFPSESSDTAGEAALPKQRWDTVSPSARWPRLAMLPFALCSSPC